MKKTYYEDNNHFETRKRNRARKSGMLTFVPLYLGFFLSGCESFLGLGLGGSGVLKSQHEESKTPSMIAPSLSHKHSSFDLKDKTLNYYVIGKVENINLSKISIKTKEEALKEYKSLWVMSMYLSEQNLTYLSMTMEEMPDSDEITISLGEHSLVYADGKKSYATKITTTIDTKAPTFGSEAIPVVTRDHFISVGLSEENVRIVDHGKIYILNDRGIDQGKFRAEIVKDKLVIETAKKLEGNSFAVIIEESAITDDNNNMLKETILAGTYDIEAPKDIEVDGINERDYVNTKSQTIKVRGNHKDTIQILDNRGDILGESIINESKEATILLSLVDGQHSIYARKIDKHSKISELSKVLFLNVDTTAPSRPHEIGIFKSSKQESLLKPTFLVRVDEGEDYSNIGLYDQDHKIIGEALADKKGQAIIKASENLEYGAHTIFAQVSDRADNKSRISDKFTFTIEKPSLETEGHVYDNDLQEIETIGHIAIPANADFEV